MDRSSSVFEEQLRFDGSPITSVPLRVMVQARQVATFSAAALSGAYPEGAEIALKAGREMVKRFHAADGAPGWVFSISREGKVVDQRRDLYAHAFVLFSLAWLVRVEPDRLFEKAIAATLEFIDRSFADPVNGGHWDCIPRADALRRQNPHMHLFEALIALYETTQREDVLLRCRAMRKLAVDRFLDLKTGALREHFDDAWTVSPEPGKGSVEPGHLFEWSWLLRRYEAISGEEQDEAVSAMMSLALRCGTDHARGRIADEIGEDGKLRLASSRSWPHAEALKALTMETLRGSGQYGDLIARILDRTAKVYCETDLGGGWVDHVDANDQPISRYMPASTLYHLYFGISAVEEAYRDALAAVS